MEANSNQTSKEDFDESIILKLKVEIETSPSQVISNPGDWKISDFRNLIQLVTARADELNIQRKILKGVKKVHTKQSIWNEISIKISVFRPGSSSESCKKAWKRMENKYQGERQRLSRQPEMQSKWELYSEMDALLGNTQLPGDDMPDTLMFSDGMLSSEIPLKKPTPIDLLPQQRVKRMKLQKSTFDCPTFNDIEIFNYDHTKSSASVIEKMANSIENLTQEVISFKEEALLGLKSILSYIPQHSDKANIV